MAEEARMDGLFWSTAFISNKFTNRKTPTGLSATLYYSLSLNPIRQKTRTARSIGLLLSLTQYVLSSTFCVTHSTVRQEPGDRD
jgi:hypothetical protein